MPLIGTLLGTVSNAVVLYALYGVEGDSALYAWIAPILGWSSDQENSTDKFLGAALGTLRPLRYYC